MSAVASHSSFYPGKSTQFAIDEECWKWSSEGFCRSLRFKALSSNSLVSDFIFEHRRNEMALYVHFNEIPANKDLAKRVWTHLNQHHVIPKEGDEMSGVISSKNTFEINNMLSWLCKYNQIQPNHLKYLQSAIAKNSVLRAKL